MPVEVDVVILAAVDDHDNFPSEVDPWRERFDFPGEMPIRGTNDPLDYSPAGVAVLPTGIGKVSTAISVTALLRSESISLQDTLFLSVGVAGGPPRVPIGSVVVAETIVDWDAKLRWDVAAADQPPIAPNPFIGNRAAIRLNDELVSEAMTAARGVSLTPCPGDDPRRPMVRSGTSLCGDELWHGNERAAEASYLVDQVHAGPYLATEMEDIAAATVLDRFDRLDRYLSIRGIQNPDRPPDRDRGSFDLEEVFDTGFEPAIDNAVSVASEVIDRLR